MRKQQRKLRPNRASEFSFLTISTEEMGTILSWMAVAGAGSLDIKWFLWMVLKLTFGNIFWFNGQNLSPYLLLTGK